MHWIYAHLIGDYLLQNDWMVSRKKQSHAACTVHVALYMLPFLWCDLSYMQFLAIGLQHFLQDRSNFIVWLMRVKGSSRFAEPPMAPWSIVVTDNVVHILFIALIVGR
jgi:hypothetical protein